MPADHSLDMVFDEKAFKRLRKQMGVAGKAADKALRQSNKVIADELAAGIRAQAPREGMYEGAMAHGPRKKSHGHGPRHDTPSGALSGPAIKAVGGVFAPAVRALASRYPQFYVQEFGGGVWWRKGAGGQRMSMAARVGRKTNRGHLSQEALRAAAAKRGFKRAEGHIIGVKRRSPTMASLKLPRTPAIKGGAAGYFFWPTIRRKGPEMQLRYRKAARDILTRTFGAKAA